MCAVRELHFGDDGSARTTMVKVNPPDGNSYPVYLTEGENGELMQFTGLLDKNGKEIYEGDVLYVNEIFNAKVCRDDSGTWILRNGDRGGGMLAYTHDRIAIIGNVYENTEMLIGIQADSAVSGDNNRTQD